MVRSIPVRVAVAVAIRIDPSAAFDPTADAPIVT